MANLRIEHVASEKYVNFTDQGLRIFTENYNLEWNSENVFGKMDPIMSYKTTNKSLSIEFITTGTAACQAAVDLSMYMYPTQKRDGNALYIKDPPLLRVYFKGLIQSQDDTGLLCACTNFSLERGQFYDDTTTSAQGELEGQNTGSPQATQMVVQMDLVPLHEFELGWRKITTLNTAGGLQKSYEFAPEQINTGYYVSSKKLTTGD